VAVEEWKEEMVSVLWSASFIDEGDGQLVAGPRVSNWQMAASRSGGNGEHGNWSMSPPPQVTDKWVRHWVFEPRVGNVALGHTVHLGRPN
jgi:hypothetical protein